MITKKINFRNLLVTLFLTVSAGSSHATDTDDAYSYLNQLRQRADMTDYQRNATLERAALNHAIFNTTNAIQGHYEQAGLTGFTGVAPKDRTANAGYRSLSVSENVSWDNNPNSTSKYSIDSLMSAIYHRFGFLTFNYNEVGVGISKTAQDNAYVYNMGNADLNALCQGVAFSGSGRYYENVCQPNVKIDATRFESATTLTQGKNPVIVQWPANNDTDVPPVFYEESPDPLPDYSVSGYPVSVQFNPLSFTTVTVNSFQLFNAADNTEVSPARLLNSQTDPNKKFSPLEFALFPLQRLAWNTTYRAEVNYTSNQGSDTLVWQFKTRDVGAPLYTIEAKGEVIPVPNDSSSVVVYVPPTSSYADMGGYHFRYPSGMTLQTEPIDSNTVKIAASGTVGQQAVFTISGSRTFTVQISNATPATNRPPVANFQAVTQNLSVQLDASSSTDADGAIVSYIWTTSNGLTANGKTASLNFTQTGSYTITLTVTDNQGGTATRSQVLSIKSTVTPPTEPTGSRIKGISTRAVVAPDPEKFMIAGIYVQGTESKKVLVRATGKGLINQGVSTELNAKIEVRELSTGNLLDSNDNWQSHQTASEIQTAGHAPQDATDAALFSSFNQGYYTMQVMPSDTRSGVGLVEVYDQMLSNSSRLSGISTRSYIGTSPSDYMYAGLAIQGTVKVMIRGLGKSLVAQGVSGALDDAKIVLRKQDGSMIDSNDNWATHASASTLQQRGQAPNEGSDAAMIVDLSDGLYTIEVSSANGQSGIGLIEVYEITN